MSIAPEFLAPHAAPAPTQAYTPPAYQPAPNELPAADYLALAREVNAGRLARGLPGLAHLPRVAAALAVPVAPAPMPPAPVRQERPAR